MGGSKFFSFDMMPAVFSAFSTMCTVISAAGVERQDSRTGPGRGQLKKRIGGQGRADFPVYPRDDSPENYWQSCTALEIKEGVNEHITILRAFAL